MNTNINNCFQNADVCQSILQQSTPIALRALSVTSKTLNKATALFKIALVLGNKDMKFKLNYGTECKVFNEKIIYQITDKNRDLHGKISALKWYMDVDRFDGNDILNGSASASFLRSEYLTLQFLLKLCPNLDIIDDTYMPTPLFKAVCIDFKGTAVKLLIDAGADWRITNPDGSNAFDKKLMMHLSEERKIRLENLVDYAKTYWKQLNRENTPIPSRKNYFQNADVCQSILQQSTPIAIRALSVTSKTLNKATALFKIALVLENKDMTFTSIYGKTSNVFNERIIGQIIDKNKSHDEKISALKNYMDVDRFDGNEIFKASPQVGEDSTLEFLLKLCPKLDIIDYTLLPTPLFRALCVNFKRKAVNLLIDAGADWRIVDENGSNVFDPKLHMHLSEKDKIKFEKLATYTKEYWKQLNRENTPIPCKTFTYYSPF